MVNFGVNPPLYIHSRMASCAIPMSNPCSFAYYSPATTKYNILDGAVIGGPSKTDAFTDAILNYQQNTPDGENSALVLATAARLYLDGQYSCSDAFNQCAVEYAKSNICSNLAWRTLCRKTCNCCSQKSTNVLSASSQPTSCNIYVNDYQCKNFPLSRGFSFTNGCFFSHFDSCGLTHSNVPYLPNSNVRTFNLPKQIVNLGTISCTSIPTVMNLNRPTPTLPTCADLISDCPAYFRIWNLCAVDVWRKNCRSTCCTDDCFAKKICEDYRSDCAGLALWNGCNDDSWNYLCQQTCNSCARNPCYSCP
jgi:hypothetical protein